MKQRSTTAVVAYGGTLVLGIGAFWLSFVALRDLAVLSGLPPTQAWIWPIIIDGVIVEATFAVVALRHRGRHARTFAWELLLAGAVASVAANITHAVVISNSHLPATVSAIVASVPPLVLLAMTHLTELLVGASTTLKATTRNTPASPRPASTKSAAPSADAARKQPQRTPDGAGRAHAIDRHSQGATNRTIAAELGVHASTVGRWLSAPDSHDHPEEQNP